MTRKRKHAHPLRALMCADRRQLLRHGIAAVYFIVVLCSIAAVRFLIPTELTAKLLPLLILSIPAIFSLFFTGAILLHEKRQHVHAALYIAAIKPSTYVYAKCIVIGFWGTLMGCILHWFSNPAVLVFSEGFPIWESLLAGDLIGLGVTAVILILSGVLFPCLAIIIGSLSTSMSRFALFALIADAIMLLPAAWDLFTPLPEWGSFHPVVFMARNLASPTEMISNTSDPSYWVFTLVLFVLLIILLQIASAATAAMLRRKENAS